MLIYICIYIYIYIFSFLLYIFNCAYFVIFVTKNEEIINNFKNDENLHLKEKKNFLTILFCFLNIVQCINCNSSLSYFSSLIIFYLIQCFTFGMIVSIYMGYRIGRYILQVDALSFIESFLDEHN